MRKAIAYSLTVAYVGAIVYVLTRLDASRSLLTIRWYEILPLFGLGVTTSAVNAAVLRMTCAALKCGVPWAEAFGLASANGLFNALPVRAGLGFKAAYLVSLRRLPIAGFASITGVTAAFTFVTAGLLGAVAAVVSWLSDSQDSGSMGLVGLAYVLTSIVGIAALVLGPTLLRLRFPWGLKRFAVPLAAAASSLTASPLFVTRLAVVVLLGVLVVTLRLFVITALVDEPIGVLSAVLLSTSGTLAMYASVVPGGLVVREAAISGTFVAVGGGLEAGVVIATLDRALSVFRDVIIGGAWLVIVRKHLAGLVGQSSARSA